MSNLLACTLACISVRDKHDEGIKKIAVVTLQTFYLGKHDLLTVYLGKLDFLSVTDFSPGNLPRENFIVRVLDIIVSKTIEFPLTVVVQ